MNDSELRALVRDAVARHLGQRDRAAYPPAAPVAAVPGGPHPSHGLYVTLVNVTDACVIEPSVACEHCGYCKSHGH